jgi:hypothetical protein
MYVHFQLRLQYVFYGASAATQVIAKKKPRGPQESLVLGSAAMTAYKKAAKFHKKAAESFFSKAGLRS